MSSVSVNKCFNIFIYIRASAGPGCWISVLIEEIEEFCLNPEIKMIFKYIIVENRYIMAKSKHSCQRKCFSKYIEHLWLLKNNLQWDVELHEHLQQQT